MVGFYQNLTVFVADSFAGETACDTLLQVLDLLFSVGEGLHIHTRDLITVYSTVHLADDQILRYINPIVLPMMWFTQTICPRALTADTEQPRASLPWSLP